jgi:hypothetical protein
MRPGLRREADLPEDGERGVAMVFSFFVATCQM